jgi:hypothetical protein
LEEQINKDDILTPLRSIESAHSKDIAAPITILVIKTHRGVTETARSCEPMDDHLKELRKENFRSNIGSCI